MGNLKSFRTSTTMAFLLLLAGACGPRVAKEINQKPPQPLTPPPLQITGTVLTAQNTSLDLNTIRMPLVLTFASEGCPPCREEAADFVEFFKSKGGLPKNAFMLTILIGGDIEHDIPSWEHDTGTSWAIAIDKKDPLFRKYCPNLLTPCTITFDPRNHNFRTFLRKIKPTEAEGETGPWVY